MKVRTVLFADEGMIITDGEVYARGVALAEGLSEDNYYEITQEEYDRIEQEKHGAENAEDGE